jgi:predicted S18 family serine protease
MKKKTISPTRTATIYILIFVLGVIIGNQVLVQPESTQQLNPLPVQNYSASANILAVKSIDNSGVLGKVTIEIYPGKGRVLMNTNPFLEPDTQFSAETAVNVAQEFTKMDLSDKDVIISFDIGGELLGGPSAGAAMTAATIAAIEEKQVKEDVAITGTVESTGEIGVIGGVIEKAQAAADTGIKLFLVPEDLLYLTYYEREIKQQRIGGFVIQRVNYIPKQLDLNNYTMSEWDMETKGVSTVEDVVKYMIE